MLKASRNSLTPSGLPLCVFCAVQNPIVHNQRLLARTVYSSGKKPEEDPASPAEQRLNGSKRETPTATRSPGSQWDPASPIATGSSGIDRAILSSFSQRNTGTGWSRGEGASEPLRIIRQDYQQGWKSLGQYRAAQNQTGSGYQRSLEVRSSAQGSATAKFGQGGYPGTREVQSPTQGGATTLPQQGNYQGTPREARPPIQGSATTRFGQGSYQGFTREVQSPTQGGVTARFGQGGYQGFTREVQSPTQGSATARFGQGGYQGFPREVQSSTLGRATTPSQQGGYQGSRETRSPIQGSATTRFGQGGYQGSPREVKTLIQWVATTTSPQGGYQGSSREARPPIQGSATTRFGQGGYQGFTREVQSPTQGNATARFGQGGYQGFPREVQSSTLGRATTPSQQGDYQGPPREIRPSAQRSAAYPTQQGRYQGFTREVRPPIQGSVAAPSQQGGYNPMNRYSPSDEYNSRNGYNSRGGYNLRDDHRLRDQRDGYNTRGGYNPRAGYTPTGSGRPPSSENYTPDQQTLNAGSGYQPQVQKPVPLIQSDEIIIRPPEPEYNDYQKRRAGRSRDKSRDRLLLDEYESAILEEGESHKDRKAAKRAKKRGKKDDTPKMIPLYLPEYISVPNLAKALKIRLEVFTKQMEEMGFTEVSHDHILNAEVAGLIAMEYNYEPIMDNSKERDLLPRPTPEDRSVLPKRPPVVTIMGHVDHGKTSLLDWLRKTSVTATEHGGITQHIGAFSVNMPGGENITFLDTPGHEAFLTMRERGANVTDIVILVVAADDSVMPQTKEAIKHAKAANVPIIVAVNKIDKEDADVDKVKQDLAYSGVTVEGYGGDTQVIYVSAKTGKGMDELEEATVTLSEVLDMRAEDDGPCEGWVLEAGTKRGGHIATVLVRRGTLWLGDSIVAGETWAKVRQLINEHGVEVESAGPGTPVQVLGWKGQPEPGQLAIQADSEAKAKDVIEFRQEKAERLRQAADMEAINEKRRRHREMEGMEATIREEAKAKKEDPDAAVLAWEKSTKQEVSTQPKLQEVGFIVKGDVGGSVEAVVGSIVALGNEEVVAKVVKSSFGNVSEFDVDYAAAVEGYILCFNVSPDPEIIIYARNKGVTILSHSIIYHLVDDVKRLLSDHLAPTIVTTVTGTAQIEEIFNISIKKRQSKPVAGCKVTSGVIAKKSKVKVTRGDKTIFEGMLGSLKNVKQDIMEMRKGGECGMAFENWDKFQVGDIVQCYETTLVPRSL